MSNSELVGYIGDPDFHDGCVLSLEHKSETIRVRLCGASGRHFLLTFGGVKRVKASTPEGMPLYALSEFTCTDPDRRFVFANWDDESKSELEIEAESIVVQPE